MSVLNDLDFSISKLPKNYAGHLNKLDFSRIKKGLAEIETQGFDNTELWNLDTSLVNFLLPRLKVFKTQKCSYPGDLPSGEAWDRILDKMIVGFEIYLDSGNSWGNTRKNRQIDLAFKLLALYIRDLWD
jgi:hypothetical protein